MEFDRLRQLLKSVIVPLYGIGHKKIDSLCRDLRIPSGVGSRHDRLESSLNEVKDEDLPALAGRALAQLEVSSFARNQIQDILWSAMPCPEIVKRYRREIAQSLQHDDLFGDAGHFQDLLWNRWVLENDDPLFGIKTNASRLRASIERHVFLNPGDWSPDFLFDELGAYEAPDRRFGSLPRKSYRSWRRVARMITSRSPVLQRHSHLC